MTLNIQTGISARSQESSFMNATLNTLDSGLACSIAVYLPDHAQDLTIGQLVQMLEQDLKHLTDVGYEIEVQIGPDDA